jgi:hypothetical protein
MSCELFEGVFGKKFKNFTRKIREKEKKKTEFTTFILCDPTGSQKVAGF